MKAVRMASYADADRTVFGSAGQGTRNFRPGRRIQSRTMPASNIGIYLHRPPDRLGPILRNAGKILRRRARLQRGEFGILPFPAFFQKRLHASGVFPFFHGEEPVGNSSIPSIFSALSQDHVSSGLSFSVWISSLQGIE